MIQLLIKRKENRFPVYPPNCDQWHPLENIAKYLPTNTLEKKLPQCASRLTDLEQKIQAGIVRVVCWDSGAVELLLSSD